MGVLLLFFVPPTIAPIFLAGMLHTLSRAFEDESRGFKIYCWFRVGLALLGFVGLLVFKHTGGYDNLSSSAFSPIGTDGRGLIVLWLTVTVIVFGIVSLFELLKILGDRILHDPDRKRSEQDADRKPDNVVS